MTGDAWDFCLILEWADTFWYQADGLDNFEPDFRILLAQYCLDLARCFDACVKAHIAAFELNSKRKDLPV